MFELMRLFMPKLYFTETGPAGGGGDAGAEGDLEKELGEEGDPPAGDEKTDEEKQKEEAKELGLEEDATKEEIETARTKKEEEDAGNREIDVEGIGKFKVSELKDIIGKGKDYTKKTQELADREKSVKELQDWAEVVKGDKRAIDVLLKFSSKLMNDKGEYDGALLEKMQGVLDGKVEGAKAGLEAQEIELEKELEELDPDSPMYKVVKKSLDQIKQLQERLDKSEKEAKENRETKAQEDHEGEVKHAQQVYRGTLDGLTDTEKDDSLKFKTDSGKKIWESLVSAYMKDNPKEYKDEADFIQTLKEVGKACHQTLGKFSEALIADYLKNKGKPTESEKEEGEGKTQVIEGDRSKLEDAVAEGLKGEMAGNEAK